MLDKHIEIFLAIADCGSFSSAAEKLFVTRSALMQQMNLLEDHLGFKLFIRSNKGVKLTASGILFYNEAQKIHKKLQSVIEKCISLERTLTVRVGVLPGFPSVILPPISQDFCRKYPDILVEFIENPLDDFFKNFNLGKFDVTAEYLAGYYYNETRFSTLKLNASAHIACMPASLPLAEKSQITIEDLDGQTLLMYARGITAADDALRDLLEAHTQNLNIVDVKTYNSSHPMYCQLHNALLIIYDGYECNVPGLVKRPLVLEPVIPIHIGLGYHQNAPEHVQMFLDFAAEKLRQSGTEKYKMKE